MVKITRVKTKHTGHERADHDWYVEPPWCIDLLIESPIKFDRAVRVVDPCCGEGRIPKAFEAAGFKVAGSDIVVRGYGVHRDFLVGMPPYSNDTLIFNPPYAKGLPVKFIRRALDLTSQRVAVVVRLDFLASQGRKRLYDEWEPEAVLGLSRRPSMPPGGTTLKPKGGQHDYTWIVWPVLERRVRKRHTCKTYWLA